MPAPFVSQCKNMYVNIDFKKSLPERPVEADKNFFGRVMVAAGCETMTGAAHLCSKAALKSGAGLVYCACGEEERKILSSLLPEAINLPLPSKDGFIKPAAAKKLSTFISDLRIDVLAIGPGLGQGGREFALRVLSNGDTPAVVDADALNALASNKKILKVLSKRPCILTPHEGEMRRLIGDFTDRRSAALKLNKLTGAVVLLKGRYSIVTDGKRIYENKTGCSALAKGGSGDVLTGLIAGIWAQKARQEKDFYSTAFLSAAIGANLHGLMGEIAASKIGERSVLARELLDFIGEAFKKIK